MNCACGQTIEQDRLSVLPDTRLCSGCAVRLASRGMDKSKPKGIMVYIHKTAPTLQVVSEEYFDNEWKKYNPKFGRGSGTHAMSPRSAGTH